MKGYRTVIGAADRAKSQVAFVCAMACLLVFTTPSQAQWVDPDSPTQQAIDQAEDPFTSEEHAVDDPDAAENSEQDDCDWYLEQQPWQEQTQELLRGMSCHSFRWFDGLWGDEKDYDENAVNGLLTFGTRWREYDGFDPRLRFKVRAPLPNLDNRMDLILGRVDEEAFVSDTQAQDRMFYNPGIGDSGRESSWLLGLGHRRKGRKSGWDTSLGIRLRFPPELYGKLQYYFNKALSPNTDLRFRQTAFWRSDDGFGTTSRGDLAWGINSKNVLRWEGIATISQESEGVEWYAGQTWYHLLGGRSAYSFLTYARGKTEADSELQDFGFSLIWRRPFTREWMYLSMGPSLTWPRELGEEKREMSFGFNLWIEVEFGNWRY